MTDQDLARGPASASEGSSDGASAPERARGPASASEGSSDGASAPLDRLASLLRERLLEGAEDDVSAPAERIAALVEREAGLLDGDTRAELTRRVTERALGLGPLQPLLEDPTVDEIMVSGLAEVWVERAGRLEATAIAFATDAQLRDVIERVLAPAGRRVDEASPLADARLPDGSRVNVVIPPLAVDGPALTIRRFRRRGFTGEELVAAGTLTTPLLEFLAGAVRSRCNILVCGGTGSGKTTTLNALGGFIGAVERVVTIEDAAELRLPQPHVVRLEARPPSLEGRGEVPIRALVRNALPMRAFSAEASCGIGSPCGPRRGLGSGGPASSPHSSLGPSGSAGFQSSHPPVSGRTSSQMMYSVPLCSKAGRSSGLYSSSKPGPVSSGAPGCPILPIAT